MSTDHERACKGALDKALDKDPAWESFLHGVILKLQRKEYTPALVVDAIFQKNWRREITLVDAFCFAQVWGHMMSGELCLCEVNVGTTPSPDAEAEINRHALDDLPVPFEAIVDPDRGRSAHDDGQVLWRESIALSRMTVTSDDMEEHSMWTCPPKRVSLEIGTTAASRTLLHLREDGGVARWPYGHTWMLIFRAHPSLLGGRFRTV